MSAVQDLLDFIERAGWDGTEMVQKALDEHASALATKMLEWLRSQGYETDCVCEGCSACLARDFIDLINPKAER